MYGGDAAGTSDRTDVEGIADATARSESHKVDMEDAAAVSSGVVLADQRLYVGTRDGGVVAIDAGTLELLWTASQGSGPVRTPAVADGTVVTSTRGGQIRGHNVADGTLEWNKDVGPDTTAPIIADGTVYVRGGGKLLALALSNGAVRGRFPLREGELPVVPSVVGDTVVIHEYSNLLALSAPTLEKQWEREQSTQGQVALTDGMVFSGASRVEHDRDLSISAFDRDTGELVWTVPLPGAANGDVKGGVSVDRERVYAGASGKLYAVSRADQRVAWSHDEGGSIHWKPVIGAELAYFGVGTRLVGLDRTAGDVVYSSNSRPDGPLLFTDGYVFSASGGIRAWAPAE
jgi:outer membrane protein assembly factor BamB